MKAWVEIHKYELVEKIMIDVEVQIDIEDGTEGNKEKVEKRDTEC
jgi:hypothetical protein